MRSSSLDWFMGRSGNPSIMANMLAKYDGQILQMHGNQVRRGGQSQVCYIGSMELFDCPVIWAGPVELTDEREAHIHERHGELLPVLYRLLRDTLEFPHIVSAERERHSYNSPRWHTNLRNGKYAIIVVGTQRLPGNAPLHNHCIPITLI